MARIWLALLLTCSPLLADPAKPAKPGEVYPVPLVKEDKLAVKPGVWEKPSLIGSEKEAENVISDEATRKRLLGLVDLSKYDLLVFAWEGSGQDKIEVQIQESFPVMIRFVRKLGATDDLRQHIQLYAVQKGLKWSAK